MARIFSGTLLALLVLLSAPALAGKAQVPEQQGYVSDYAAIVDEKTELALALILKTLEDKYGSKVVILTIESTAPLEIDDYSAAVFAQWGLGQDDLLFLVALRDGRIRLDPGKRLNRALTDEKLRQILERDIMPSFQEGEFSQGILRGTIALTSAIKEIKKQQAQTRVILWIGLGLLIAATAAVLLFWPR
ncbi:MAG: TPM domain-containing protein [Candidatus Acetothermia bacterium]|nr:TPM domain-containing protein [Candidatus Acetothermia bacterium]MDH7505273.1 TPM domain-containing protein [Candidatus Acetothermia bacterium]